MIIQNMADVYYELSILDRILETIHDYGDLDDNDQKLRQETLRIVFEERFVTLFRTVTEVHANRKAVA